MKTPVSRRNLLMGTVALGTTGLLAACGGGKSNKPGGTAATDSADVLSRVNVNKQEYSSLKKGGELRLVVTSLGPNFNTLTQTGYTSSNLDAINACNIPSGAGFFNVDYNGDLSLNSDLCLEHKAETKDGKQIIRMKLNPKAKFNDGTPMDIEAVRACWTLYGKTTEETGYELLESEAWKLVESIEEDGDKFSVKITTKSPYYPAESLFATAVHPALTDKELFNQGFVDKPLDQYWAGPYKVAENGWNSAEKTLTLVPNPNWWGEKKALLDRIVWREMTTDAIRAAFKNGDVDATQFVENNTYTELKGQAGTDIREGQRTGVRDVHLNPKRITDLALRRAIAAALDRAQLATLCFLSLAGASRCPALLSLCLSKEGTRITTPKKPVPVPPRRFWKKPVISSMAIFMRRTAKKQNSLSPTSVVRPRLRPWHVVLPSKCPGLESRRILIVSQVQITPRSSAQNLTRRCWAVSAPVLIRQSRLFPSTIPLITTAWAIPRLISSVKSF